MSKHLRKHCIRCKKEELDVQHIPLFDLTNKIDEMMRKPLMGTRDRT